MSQAARQRQPATRATDASGEHRLLTLEEVQQEAHISTFIAGADRVMEGLGYTEHGFRHANLTSRIAFNILSRLGFEGRMAGLASIAHAAQRNPACLPEQLLWIAEGSRPDRASAWADAA